MITENNYLNLWESLVNQVIGDPILFVIVCLGVILLIAAYAKFSNGITLMVVLTFLLFMGLFISLALPIAIIGITGFFGYQLYKWINTR